MNNLFEVYISNTYKETLDGLVEDPNPPQWHFGFAYTEEQAQLMCERYSDINPGILRRKAQYKKLY